MKKLLSLLSVLTISGTAVPTTIAASPYKKEENIKNSDINYQQTNNLKRIKRQDYKNAINWTINNGIIRSIIVGNNYAYIKNNIVVLNDILYIFVQGSTINKNKIYKYNIKTGKESEIVIQTSSSIINSIVVLNNKIYFTDMGKKIHEFNSINEQIKFLSNTEKVLYNGISFNNKLYFNSLDGTIYEYNPNTEKEILIANFTDNNSEYKISPPFIFNYKIYYFLDNTSVFYYDLNNKIVHKKTSFGHGKTNYIFSKPILFKNNLIVIATNVDMTSSDIIYTKTYNNINSSGKTTNIENRKLIVSDFLINKDELYLVTKDGNIYKNSSENDFGDFVLFNSLNVSIENATIFDDKIYFSSNNELYELYLVTKEKKIIVNLSNSTKEYKKINFIKVLDNILYFDDNDGKVYEYLPIKYMIKDYELLRDWEKDLNNWISSFNLESENKQNLIENKINEFNNKFLIFKGHIQTIINLERINTLENRIYTLENKVTDICNEIKKIAISLKKDNTSFIISSIGTISGLIPVIGSALSAILSIASSAI